MSIVNTLALESNRQIKINFYGGDLSSDAGLLLIKEFISKLGIDTLLEKAFKTNAPVFKSVLEKDALASQPTVSRFFNRMDEEMCIRDRNNTLPNIHFPPHLCILPLFQDHMFDINTPVHHSSDLHKQPSHQSPASVPKGSLIF